LVVIDPRKAFAWEDGGKFFLSRVPHTSKLKSRNTYETRDALAIEARSRGITVVWINTATN
jgi:hypothetical protein